MSLMKWPGTTDKPNKPDLSKWSDDELDNLMVAAGLMEQDELNRQRDSRLVIALANLPGGTPEYHETLRGLMHLRNEGSFPLEAMDLYERLRSRAMADVEAAHKAAPKVTSSPADVPDDVSLAGWLKFKWTSADEAVRKALQAVASAVGASIPLSRTRTRPVAAKDSGSTRRMESEQQPSQAEARRKESPPEPEPEDHYDGPQWSDDDALDWKPCTSLHDAFRSDDSEWY